MSAPVWESVVPSFVAELLSRAGYPKPSPVQVKSLPLVRLGLDVVVHARAGTGKTLVFAIAAAEKALAETVPTTVNKPRVLFVAPTREIALQGAGVLSDLSSACGMTVVTCIGGLPTSEDERLLRRGCDVVVGTPGRLAALMVDRHCLDPSCIDMLVLDEADRLTENPFFPDLRRMVDQFRPECPYQLVALSATFEGHSVERLEMLRSSSARCGGKKLFVCEAMSTPVSVVHYTLECVDESSDEADTESVSSDVDVGHVGRPDRTGERVDENEEESSHMNTMPGKKYARQLERVFCQVPFRQAIVFCPSRKAAEATTRALVAESHAAALLSSDMDQLARIRALNDLRQYRTRVLVSTDVASRGIDLPNVDLVCNVGRLPTDPSTLKHRIGRAGRFGQPGIAVTLMQRGDVAYGNSVQTILNEARDFVEYEGVKADIDVHAPQSVVVVRHVGGTDHAGIDVNGVGAMITAEDGRGARLEHASGHDADDRCIMEASLFSCGNSVLKTYASHFEMLVESCAMALQTGVEQTMPSGPPGPGLNAKLSSSLRLLTMAFSKVEDIPDSSTPGLNKNSRSLGTTQSRGLEASLSQPEDVLISVMADRDALAREADMLEQLMLG